jgi:hypothetical protein
VKGILSFLANLLLFLSISTLLFSVAAYVAFKIKAKRKPRAANPNRLSAGSAEAPPLLQQYVQPEPQPNPARRAGAEQSNQKPTSRAP